MGLPGTIIDVRCISNPEMICRYRSGQAELFAHRPTEPNDSYELASSFARDDRILQAKGVEHALAARAIGCDALPEDLECPIAIHMQQSPARTKLRDLVRIVVGLSANNQKEQ